MANDKEYSNDEITVFWKPDICIHSAECVKGLPKVFNPEKKPWIDINAASAGEIASTINNCPSGALSYKLVNMLNEKNQSVINSTKLKINRNGPIIVEGNFNLFDSEGNLIETKSRAALCRCGASANKPFCDGSHSKISFTE